MTGPIRVYYAQNEFIGAGTSLRPLTLTVLLSKPPDASRDVDAFNVSELMTKLRDHLISQAAGDAEEDGRANEPLPPNGADLSPHEPGHFTYGLPHLDVTEVEATPAPDKDRWLDTPIIVRRFDFHSPPDHDMPGLANRSPSVHPERHYVRVIDNELARPADGHGVRERHSAGPLPPGDHAAIRTGACSQGPPRRLRAHTVESFFLIYYASG